MGTTPTIKLIRGARKLDLTSGRYRVSRDFSPPPVQQVTTVASGTSANRTGNVIAVDRRAKTRTWSWSIDVYGDTEAEVRRGLSDLSAFLAWAGDDADPVYLSYKPNSDTPEPVWGQDGTLRYEIIEGNVDIGNSYGVQRLREKYVSTNPVSLSIQPYAVGLPQTCAQAKGSIIHDTPGTTDGRDKGVIVCNPQINYFTNPVFGHATWNSGWTAGANLTASENSDARFVLYGVRSGKLQATGASRLFYQALTLSAATFTLTFYAKRPDGDAVTASDCVAYFAGTLQTSTYTRVGDGWYRVSYTGTATGAAANYGVGLAANALVYVDGFQVENSGYATALAHGDMYGCAWSGTAHSSTTTRTAPYLRVPLTADTFNVGQGSIRCVVTVPNVPTTNFVVWQEAATSMRIYYAQATSQWTLSDNTNSVTYTLAITAGATYVLHAVWEGGRLQLYLNGASVASGGTFTAPSATPTYLYIGSDATPAFQQTQTFKDFAIFGEALTTAQVLADYTNIAPIVADGQRVTSVPYFWTKDGDSQVDTFDDSSNDNWGVIQGVPGTSPADTEYALTCATAGVIPAGIGIWQTGEFISPSRLLYQEHSGTVDANSSGGQYSRVSIGTTATFLSSTTPAWTTDPRLYRFVENRQWYVLARVRAATTGGQIYQALALGGSNYILPNKKDKIASAFFRFKLLSSIHFPKLATDSMSYSGLSHYIFVKNTAAAVNTDLDFYTFLPRPLALLKLGSSYTYVRGSQYAAEDTSGGETATGTLTEPIEAIPDVYNVLFLYNYQDSVASDTPKTSWNFTIKIRPRYALV